MLNNILNIEGVSVLNKEQQSQVKGSDGCHVFIRDGEGNAVGWSPTELSYSRAKGAWFMSEQLGGGYYVSGYCCASCDARGVH